MACNLTKGRNITCRDGIGGIKAIYIAQHDQLTSYVAASGSVTDFDLGSGDDLYKYLLKILYVIYTSNKVNKITIR